MKVGCFYCQVIRGHDDAFGDIERSVHVSSDMGLKLE